VAEGKQGWVWRHRIVVVRDKPNAIRSHRWALERVTARGTSEHLHTGRARSFNAAIRKAVKKAEICPWMAERVELEMFTRDELKPECSARQPSPLPPELLPPTPLQEGS
jgi:hypothetical protein